MRKRKVKPSKVPSMPVKSRNSTVRTPKVRMRDGLLPLDAYEGKSGEELETSREELSRSIAAAPKDWSLRFNRALVNFHLGHAAEAHADLQAATVIGTHDEKTWINFGALFLKIGRQDLALPSYTLYYEIAMVTRRTDPGKALDAAAPLWFGIQFCRDRAEESNAKGQNGTAWVKTANTIYKIPEDYWRRTKDREPKLPDQFQDPFKRALDWTDWDISLAEAVEKLGITEGKVILQLKLDGYIGAVRPLATFKPTPEHPCVTLELFAAALQHLEPCDATTPANDILYFTVVEVRGKEVKWLFEILRRRNPKKNESADAVADPDSRSWIYSIRERE